MSTLNQEIGTHRGNAEAMHALLQKVSSWKAEFQFDPAAALAKVDQDPTYDLALPNETLVAVVRLLWAAKTPHDIVDRLHIGSHRAMAEQEVYTMLVRHGLHLRGPQGEIRQLWAFISAELDKQVAQLKSTEFPERLHERWNAQFPGSLLRVTRNEHLRRAITESACSIVDHGNILLETLRLSEEFRGRLVLDKHLEGFLELVAQARAECAASLQQKLEQSWLARYFPKRELALFHFCAVERKNYAEIAHQGLVRSVDGEVISAARIKNIVDRMRSACPALGFFLPRVNERKREAR